MIDKGTSCHMIGDLTMMQETEKILPVFIELSNGTHTLASREGVVLLRKRIKLSKVLYVLSLKYNLISITKISKKLNCSVIFFDDFCVLQDRTSRTLIDVGEEQRGVYYFKDGSLKRNQVNAVNYINFWQAARASFK